MESCNFPRVFFIFSFFYHCFAESNVANERSSANEGDEGSESNERSVYRSQAIKAIKAMKTPLKVCSLLLGLQFGGSKPSSGLGP